MTTMEIAIIAIIAWQLATLIVFLACGQNDESLVVGMLVPWVAVYCVCVIFRKVYFAIAKKFLNCYCFGWTGSDGREFVSGQCFYTTERWAKKMRRKGSGGYFVVFESDCKNMKSAPHFSDIYRGQKSFRGWTDMSKFFYRE